jgi:hypothetical protein
VLGEIGEVATAVGAVEKVFPSLSSAFKETDERRMTCLYFWKQGSIRIIRETSAELRRVPWLSHVFHLEELQNFSPRAVDKCFKELVCCFQPYFGQIRSDGRAIESISFGLPSSWERLYLARDIEKQIPGLAHVSGKAKPLANGFVFDRSADVENAIGARFLTKANDSAQTVVSHGVLGFLDFFKELAVSKLTTRPVFHFDRTGCIR